MRHMRVIGPALVAVVAIGALAGGGAARAWAGLPLPTSPAETRYAKVRQVCPAPKSRDASCFALELLPAPAGAAGVQPYTVGAGSSSKGPAGGLTPADLASAYGFAPAAGGTGQ